MMTLCPPRLYAPVSYRYAPKSLFIFMILCLSACTAEPEETHSDRRGDVPPQEQTDLPPPSDFPHALCVDPEIDDNIAEDFASFCASGSNLAMCALSSFDCSSNICLWHTGDPAQVYGYCTMTCEPSDANGCPADFACQMEECHNMNVCVRIATTPEPQLPYAQTLDALPYDSYWAGLGLDSQGTVTLANALGHIFQKDADGLIHDLGEYGDYEARTQDITMIGDKAYVYGADPNYSGWLAIVEDGQVNHQTYGNTGGITGVFKTPAGEARLLVRSRHNNPVGGIYTTTTSLQLEMVQQTVEQPNIWGLKALSEYGFVGSCDIGNNDTQLCAGTNGTDTQLLPVPPEEISLSKITGATPDSFWALGSNNNIFYFDGSQWLQEDVELFYPRFILALPNQEVLIIDFNDILHFKDGCWFRWKSGDFPNSVDISDLTQGLALGDGKVFVPQYANYFEIDLSLLRSE